MLKSKVKSLLAPALLIFAILVVLLNAWFAFRAVETLLSSERWVQHTWQVIYQVERINSSAEQAETGTRGYLITGEQSYLQPYLSASQDLPREIDEFARLTSDSATQQARIASLRTVVSSRLALLQHSIDLRRSGDTNMLESFILSGSGQAEMDRLRYLGDRMEDEERRLLLDRSVNARREGRSARFTIGLASALDLFLILLMFRYFIRERSLRFATERANTDLAIARSQAEAATAEVSLLNVTLEERVRLRTAELETTNRELEAFSYSVSHDLRAPLRTIDGFSLALEEDYAEAVGATGKDYIRRVRTGVQRMGQLIDALLQLSRITRAELTREPLDLSALAHTITANLADDGPGSPAVFHIEDGLTAVADPRLVQVALENLLGNAVKFSAKVDAPTITFGWDPAQSAWFVRDNGAGFDMYYKDRLFNAFNRLHGDKDFKGSGIGLATVARVVHRHLGRIWADARVGHGATFWFTLG